MSKHWAVKNSERWCNLNDNLYALVYAPHLSPHLPWSVYCYQGKMYGDYSVYETREIAEFVFDGLARAGKELEPDW